MDKATQAFNQYVSQVPIVTPNITCQVADLPQVKYDDNTLQVWEQSRPGVIIFNQSTLLDHLKKHTLVSWLPHILQHALFHAASVPSYVSPTEEFKVSNAQFCNGYRGLALRLTDHQNPDDFFWDFEEAAAEATAFRLNPSHLITPIYEPFTVFTLEVLEKRKIDYLSLAQMSCRNDLPRFVSTITGQPFTSANNHLLMSLYRGLKNLQIGPSAALKEIGL